MLQNVFFTVRFSLIKRLVQSDARSTEMAGTASDDRAARCDPEMLLYTEYRIAMDTSAPERTTDNLSYRQPGALPALSELPAPDITATFPECFATHPRQ